MIRAGFTIETNDGVRRDANHLAITWAPSPEGQGSISMLTFECSGQLVSVPAASVTKVAFYQSDATWCPHCDQSLWNVVGWGIHANPKGQVV